MRPTWTDVTVLAAAAVIGGPIVCSVGCSRSEPQPAVRTKDTSLVGAGTRWWDAASADRATWPPPLVHAGLSGESTRPDWIVLTADPLAPVARRWAAYRARQGRRTLVWTVSDVLAGRQMVAHEFLAAVRAKLKQVLGTARPQESIFFLLLGDARDPDVHPTVEPELVPTFSWHTEYLTDLPYSDINGDGWPDLALGRVPVDTVAQAEAVLAKTMAYEQDPDPGLWRHRLLLFASEGYFGPLVDALMERIGLDLLDALPRTWEVVFLHARRDSVFGLPPDRYTKVLLDQFQRGALIAVYTGHGYLDSLEDVVWGKERAAILDEESAERIACGRHCPILVLAACHTGDFGHGRALAEVLEENPEGPPAVIAATDVSHPYANALLALKVARLVTERHTRTVGEAFLEALLSLGLPDTKAQLRMDTLVDLVWNYAERKELLDDNRRMYVLLGDPALKLPVEEADLSVRVCSITRASVTVCGVSGRHRRVRLELRRPRFLLRPSAKEVQSSDEAVRRWASANEHVLATQIVPSHGGYYAARFALPSGWDESGLVVRALSVDGTAAAWIRIPVERTGHRRGVGRKEP